MGTLIQFSGAVKRQPREAESLPDAVRREQVTPPGLDLSWPGERLGLTID
jgi:hypothetical protein